MIRRSLLIAAALACTAAAPAPVGSGYHLVKSVTLGGDGFWDYLSIDPARRHLFVSHGTHVMVLDADTYAVVGDIPNTPRVHGIAVAKERGFVSDGGDNTVTMFDLASLKVLGKITVGTKPDAIIYDPATNRVFTMNAGSNDATAIDAATGTVIGTVALGGGPEFAAADGKGHVFVNLEDQSEMVKFDSRKLTVEAHWPMAPCEGPSGLAIDRANERLFAGCHNETMAIVDGATGKVIATPAIGKGVDANRFDDGYAFSSNGYGTLTVVHEDTPDSFTVVDNVPTQLGARTMEVDPKTHTVFLVTADLVATPPTADNPHPRPTITPGTFRLLAFARP
ncbi:MAG TPA: YncE family protein [Rhizomicrobium sp.]|jgi:YVTN family beta-propeller protein